MLCGSEDKEGRGGVNFVLSTLTEANMEKSSFQQQTFNIF